MNNQGSTQIQIELNKKLREFGHATRSFEITDKAVCLAQDVAYLSAQLSIAVNAERAEQQAHREAIRGDIA